MAVIAGDVVHQRVEVAQRSARGSDGGLHGRNLVRVRVHPLQTRCSSHLLQFIDGQCERLDARQALGRRCCGCCRRRCCSCRSGCRDRSRCRHGGSSGCDNRRGNSYRFGSRCDWRCGHRGCHRCHRLCGGRVVAEVAAARRLVLCRCGLGLGGVEVQHGGCCGFGVAVGVAWATLATFAAVTAVAVAGAALAALLFAGAIAIAIVVAITTTIVISTTATVVIATAIVIAIAIVSAGSRSRSHRRSGCRRRRSGRRSRRTTTRLSKWKMADCGDGWVSRGHR